ncbi:MAG: DUF1295 domain-containing protein [Gammaproteobacteria bacterium]|nr:DUF1295 domain-containing protein [Gammaproteobacteria bacterium]MCY4276251.1 DUF1295 domain-containing protein [Gammaproteobacteria bacterium]
MNPNLAWVGTALALLAAAAIAFVGSPAGTSLFALLVALAFIIQWIAFVPAYLKQTEHFYDLTGSLTFITLAVPALVLVDDLDLRTGLIGGLTIIWALRLGAFLSLRVRKAGFDRRFRSIKPVLPVFFMTWTLQGLWVTMSLAPGLVAMTSAKQVLADPFLAVGACLWLIGFVVQVVADEQKRKFRSNADNQDKFITSGLWAWSQHPNYFGEILLWTGIAVIAFPVLEGWQHVTLVSPVFVWLLLTRISGTRMLDNSAKKKWGDDAAYRAYVEKTPKLILWPPGG